MQSTFSTHHPIVTSDEPTGLWKHACTGTFHGDAGLIVIVNHRVASIRLLYRQTVHIYINKIMENKKVSGSSHCFNTKRMLHDEIITNFATTKT